MEVVLICAIGQTTQLIPRIPDLMDVRHKQPASRLRARKCATDLVPCLGAKPLFRRGTLNIFRKVSSGKGCGHVFAILWIFISFSSPRSASWPGTVSTHRATEKM